MVWQRQKSRIHFTIQNECLEQFIARLSAPTIAKLMGVNRKIAILVFKEA
jgi:hypothetical protein